MAIEFFIPKLGQTVEEVTLVKWLVKDGAKVSQGQEVMEVETDKAVFPVEANGKGYIHFGPYEEGQVLPVLTVVAIIGKEDEKFSITQSAPVEAANLRAESGTEASETAIEQAASTRPAEADEKKIFASPRARKLAAEKHVDLRQATPTGWGGERITERDVLNILSQSPKVTPLAQRLAADTGVDLLTISGTGPRGRIVKEDVQKASRLASAVPATSAESTAPLSTAEVTERIPLGSVRAIIADRMSTSVHTTARVTLMVEVDATELVALRERLKNQVTPEWGFAPSYNDLLMKITAAVIGKFPYMNARLTQDAIELLRPVNMGLAVDTERGLLVPVVREANKKDLRQIGAETRDLVERARKGRSLPDDLSGGTFTITNLGMYSIDAFTPVINLPEAAILGVGRIAPRPVYVGEALLRREMMVLSLAFDHRLVDGAPASRFLQALKSLIEDPAMLLTYL